MQNVAPLDYQPVLPLRRDVRIGCIGAGFIMRDCHLVAYRKVGFNPVAIVSRTLANSKAVANQHNIPTVHNSIEELLSDEQIEVLDIAVPPANQPAIIRQACQRNPHRKNPLKGILAQKPLAMSSAEGEELVQRCQQAGIVLAINQNMRYDQSIRAAKSLMNRGDLGEIVFATIEMRAIPHWMPWAEELHSLSTFVMSIHHLDTFRYWFGTPDHVLASTRPDPRTKFPHRDGINLYILEWKNGLRASSWDDVYAGPLKEGAAGPPYIRWRIEGTAGLAQGTIGWPSYPYHAPSTLEYTTTNSNGWFVPCWDDAWFPDAFAGTMAQLLVAIEQNTIPEISGLDHLQTLKLCEKVFQSATASPVYLS